MAINPKTQDTCNPHCLSSIGKEKPVFSSSHTRFSFPFPKGAAGKQSSFTRTELQWQHLEMKLTVIRTLNMHGTEA
jgi:hypothetical protein